ncbi:MAG: AMP-binding protein [Thermodesulfobacteriota bacterium]
MAHLPLARPSSGPSWGTELLEVVRRHRRAAGLPAPPACFADLPVSHDLPAPEDRLYATDAPPAARLFYLTSGTTGQPKRVIFSREDWHESVRHRAACLRAVGVTPDDTVAVLLPFGPWFSGDNVTDALVELGARVLPAGLYLPHLPGTAKLLNRIGATAVVTLPTAALALGTCSPLHGIRKLILVGEAASPELRARIEDSFGVRPRSLFAASEAILGFEDDCVSGRYHWDPERIHLEVLDPDGVVRDSGFGEALVTRRYAEAIPLVRYRLGDLIELVPDASGPCFRFIGRVGHAFSLATGVKVTRVQIERFLDALGYGIASASFRIRHLADGTDAITIDLRAADRLDQGEVARWFQSLSLDLADARACGYLKIFVQLRPIPRGYPGGKRRVAFHESPWSL